MTISRWKIMACTLGLSFAGLAIVAGPINNRLNAQFIIAPSKPTPEVTLPAPSAPAAEKAVPAQTIPETEGPVVQAQAIEIVVPTAVPQLPPPPIASEPNPLPNTRLGEPEVLPTPRPAPGVNEPIPLRAIPAYPNLPPSYPPVAQEIEDVPPRAPQLPRQVLPPMNLVQPVPQLPPALQNGTPIPLPPAPQSEYAPPPVADAPTPQRPKVLRTSAATTSTKLKMLLRLGDGKPRFEIRSSDSTEMLFKVYGEKVEMPSAPEGMKSSPITGVTAMGQVRFIGPGVEGTCDQLTVLSGTGEVLLKGNVYMKTKRGKTWSEVTGEKMIYQIGASGLSTASGSSSVRPASYNMPQ